MNLSLKAKVKRTKINKYHLIKLKSFCTVKTAMNKMKESTEWEKIFANYMINKGLIYKIYKQLIQLNIKKTHHPNKNGQEN